MTKDTLKAIKCPTCYKPNTWQKDNHYRPFCSERCRLIDLGEWFEESYKVQDETREDTEDPYTT